MSFLVKEVENYTREIKIPDWPVCVELMAAGKEEFYKKFGYYHRPEEWDGHGMFKMLR